MQNISYNNSANIPPFLPEEQILITGGAGFIGSNIAIAFKEKYPQLSIIALDNLKRRGSELNVERLKEHEIQFIHGDVRNKEDLNLGQIKISLIIECSAEPSVLAGYNSSPDYLIHSNLNGAINCFELARLHNAGIIFLSTSRVYPIQAINNLNYLEKETRFTLSEKQSVKGVSIKGLSEDFTTTGTRSLYGTTKLSAELFAAEYADMYGLNIVINRCGVIAGPWQMGKVDQGVFTLWMAAHYFKKELQYFGFGGKGKQVRDILHIDDLFRLIDKQMYEMNKFTGDVYNVGGGSDNALSLCETTKLCEEITGNRIIVASHQAERLADIKYYVSDFSKVNNALNWQPQKSAKRILMDIWNWIRDHEKQLKYILT